jgi:Tol biopolymer transport system component
VVGTDVWVVNADGSDPRQLTSLGAPILAGYNIAPAWSPDGTRIAFFAGSVRDYNEAGHLYVMNADGTNVRELAPASFDYTRTSWCESDRSPVWSPDGKMLAYYAYNRVFVVNPDSAEEIDTFVASSFDPEWSADGRTVAFSVGSSGCLMDSYSLDGDPTPSGPIIVGKDFTWSPDGTRLAYLDGGRILVADADGRNVMRVAEMNVIGDLPAPWNLQWSPDGTKLSFMFFELDTSRSDMWIYIVDLASPGIAVRLVSPGLWFYDWSPDSRTIVYQVQEDDSCHYPDVIYTRNADGSGGPTEIVRGTSPGWSPDGSKIVFMQETLPETCPTPIVIVD